MFLKYGLEISCSEDVHMIDGKLLPLIDFIAIKVFIAKIITAVEDSISKSTYHLVWNKHGLTFRQFDSHK